jgi:hypothetical protein
VPDVPAGPVSVDRVRSTARGRDVDLVVMRPASAAEGLPTCLALHGRGVGAKWFLDLGCAEVPHRGGAGGGAAVRGRRGDSYYVARDPSDDPLRMLVTELPAWLAERGLAAPVGAFGISMGAFGVLRLARERDLRAVAVAGPALFRSWTEAKERNAFRDDRQWAANEPLRHTREIAGVPLGVWCGTDDPFVDAARELVDRAGPEVATIGPGTHEDGYFLRVLPDMIRFVGLTSHWATSGKSPRSRSGF